MLWTPARRCANPLFYQTKSLQRVSGCVPTTVVDACAALHNPLFYQSILLSRVSACVQTTVVDACAALREKLTEIKGLGPAAQYGLFLADEDPKKGTDAIQSGLNRVHFLPQKVLFDTL
jgi:hypothetical protein